VLALIGAAASAADLDDALRAARPSTSWPGSRAPNVASFRVAHPRRAATTRSREPEADVGCLRRLRGDRRWSRPCWEGCYRVW